MSKPFDENQYEETIEFITARMTLESLLNVQPLEVTKERVLIFPTFFIPPFLDIKELFSIIKKKFSLLNFLKSNFY